jgi:hypothetical protein
LAIAFGNRLQRQAQRLHHQLQAVQLANGTQHRQAIGALCLASAKPAFGSQALQKSVEDAPCRFILDESVAELAQDAGIKTGILQRQMQRILPVDAPAHHLHSNTIRAVLSGLQHGNQGQVCRGKDRLSGVGIKIRKIRVLEQISILITDQAQHMVG